MDKKTIIIFGVTGGIGRETTKKMLAQGYTVCGVSSNLEKSEQFQKELRHERFSAYQMDLTDERSTKSGLEQIQREHSQIEAVVFSVSAPIEYCPVLKADWSNFEKHLAIQLRGLLNIVSGLGVQIKSGRGIRFIILLTEACVGKPPAGLAPYISAKYALMGLSKSLSGELAKHNCTINMVSPGLVKTDLTAGFPAKLVELEAENNPLHRIATPTDVANVIIFLVGEGADYINGANIVVNGGGKLV